MRRVIWLLVAVAVVIVGAATEWKYVLAPLLGLTILRWATATFRSMAGGTGVLEGPPERLSAADPERTVYWCEECGTEVVLVVRGSGKAPRHCGTGMHERIELEREI